MIAKWLARLAAVPVFLVAFGAAYFTAAPSAGARLGDALELVRSEPERTVCLGGGPCLDPAAARTLFVFFSPGDCAIGLYEMAVLDEAFRATPRAALNVIGVTSGFTREQAENFVRASGISYPVYLDDGRLGRYLESPKGAQVNRPVSVLLDRGGQVLEVRAAASTVRAHRA
ncbi:MAG TPA: hypothetical protein VFX98_09870, partial [Longimicrobiaceae bacterium]|nr:hypothetical protein [Longimicrobiaceae bacterium]